MVDIACAATESAGSGVTAPCPAPTETPTPSTASAGTRSRTAEAAPIRTLGILPDAAAASRRTQPSSAAVGLIVSQGRAGHIERAHVEDGSARAESSAAGPAVAALGDAAAERQV